MNEPQEPNNQTQGTPQGDQPASPQPPQPPAQQPPAQQPPAGQKNLSGIMEENVDVSGLVANAGQNQQDSQAILSIPIPAHPNTKFDEKNFLELLAGSISLTINEKKRIVEALPQLSQFQIDELIKIFEEEKGKFAELEQKHAEQIQELEKQHAGTWQDLEAQKQEETKKQQEAQEAEDIKKQLGL